MKNYKFRAWDGKEMHYNVAPWKWDYVIDRMSHKCTESNGPGVFGSGGTRGKFEVPGIAFKGEVMQSIGQKDKKGIEIYEGDVLMYDGERADGKWSAGVVGYLEEQAAFGFVKESYGNQEGWSEWDDCDNSFDLSQQEHSLPALNTMQIVGNIYANPEILNK